MCRRVPACVGGRVCKVYSYAEMFKCLELLYILLCYNHKLKRILQEFCVLNIMLSILMR